MSDSIQEPSRSTDDSPAADEVAAAVAADERLLALAAQARNGANWFYWVAGLSVLNSAINLFGGGVRFVVGMGVTQVIDQIAAAIAANAPESATIIQGVAFVVSCLVALVAALFGWLANRGFLAAFIVGMFFYLLDGLLFLLFQPVDFLSLGFHAYALYCMWGGFSAWRELKARAVDAAFANSAEAGELG